MKTKTMPSRLFRKLTSQRYHSKIESARNLGALVSNDPLPGIAFVFPAYVYSQLKRAFR